MSAAMQSNQKHISIIGRCLVAIGGIALLAASYVGYAAGRAIGGYYFQDPGSVVPSVELLALAGVAVYFLLVGATGRWGLLRRLRKSR
jgi:hypothetical protein